MINNQNSPILLSYRVPEQTRVLLMVSMVAAFGILIAIYVKVVVDINIGISTVHLAIEMSAAVLLFLFILLMLTGVIPKIAGQIDATAAGINITSIIGRSVYSVIEWSEIRQIRRYPVGIALLKSDNSPDALLLLPKPVIDSLLSMLREASNARIIGFTREY
ncbi:MAG: hypothetical protein ACYC27_09650 [Armatimonadota bacterium]